MGVLDKIDLFVPLRRRPAAEPEPATPSLKAYEQALVAAGAMRRERDRWVAEAALKAREVLDLRVARDRAWADLEASQRTIASLQAQVDRLKEGSCDDGCRVEKAVKASGQPPDFGSWSGLKEGE